MNKFTTKFNKYFASGLLAITLLSLGANTANAGVLDWFKNIGSKDIVIESQNTPSSAFIGAVFSTEIIDKNDPVIVTDKFLLATSSPVKNPKLTNLNYFIARELTVPISAYSSTVDQCGSSPFITANGAYVYDGLIAANFLPFGTKVKIPSLFGNKIFTVEDRMNKRYDKKIDVWFPDRESALHFGIKTAKIQIVSEK